MIVCCPNPDVIVGRLVVPDGITAIGAAAFANCKYLIGIELPVILGKNKKGKRSHCILQGQWEKGM